MKLLKLICVTAAIVLVAAPAWTACPVHPVPGVYTTTNGTILPGHASEAWCAGMGPGVPGNTENAMSWGPPLGPSLGAQWHVWGMAIDPAGAQEVRRFFLPNGNGYIDYTTNYVGGQFWLSKLHTWGDGINDLTGQINYYNVQARVTYVAGHAVGLTSNVYFTGVFDLCPLCTLEYVITNAMQVWPSQPGYYPPFLCGATAGEYFDVCCIQASIYCPVGTDQSTWGAIKELYKN